MLGLVILFGVIVGFALGLTGGGGGVFAVPLLVYGLAIAPREAVGISLEAVGGTALFGAVPRLVQGEVELRTGLLFAVAGMAGAPVGAYLSKLVAEHVLLVLFAILMFVVAFRMWSKANDPKVASGVCLTESDPGRDRGACQRDEDGKLRMTSACARLLVLVGCQRANVAVVVDPGRDVAQYLEMADREGLKLIAVAETHIHADYVSGARELADRVGAKLIRFRRGNGRLEVSVPRRLRQRTAARWRSLHDRQQPLEGRRIAERFLVHRFAPT